MKKYSLIILFIVLGIAVYGQSEYYYFVFKIGVNHNLNKKPSQVSPYRFISTPDGDMPMKITNHRDYVAGYNVGLLFNVDMKKDFIGFAFGPEFTNFGIENKFTSDNGNYWVIQRYRFYILSVPAYVKLSRNVYKNQKYFYIGAQYNTGLKLQNIEYAGWTNQRYSGWGEKNELAKSNISLIFGVNFSTFNLQVDYTTKGFFNENYIDAKGFKPHLNQIQKNILVKTSFSVPLNRWLTMKNWTAEKVRRVLMLRF